MAWCAVSIRRPIAVVTAALLLGGVAFLGRSGPESDEARPRAAAVFRHTDGTRVVAPNALAAGGVVEFLQPARATSPAMAARPPHAELSADAARLTAEIAALQLLAQDSDLELASRQWAVLAEVTQEIQAVRQAYEATLATTAVVAPGRFRMEIPAYAAAGDALRARFHALLGERLGEANAAEVLARIGTRLEGHFAGFGVSVQALEITGDPREAGAEVAVTRTVRYWNSVEGGDQLTTRRETHFPRREDPASEHWGPLLSALATQIAAAGTTKNGA